MMEPRLKKNHRESQIVVFNVQRNFMKISVTGLLVSVAAADTDKKIWQGWTTERINGLSDLDVKKSVRNIFEEPGNAAP